MRVQYILATSGHFWPCGVPCLANLYLARFCDGRSSGTGHGGVSIPRVGFVFRQQQSTDPCRWRTRAWSVAGYRLPYKTAQTSHNQVAACALLAMTVQRPMHAGVLHSASLSMYIQTTARCGTFVGIFLLG
jgi:hypothetical protein